MTQFNLKAVLISLSLLLLSPLLFANEENTAVKEKVSTERNWVTDYRAFYVHFEGDKNIILFPKTLDVTTQALSLSYKIKKDTFFNISTQYVENKIHLIGGGPIPTINDKTEGISDTLIGAYKKSPTATYGLFLSVPTGSYEEKDSKGKLLSYPAQLGAGTYGLTTMIRTKHKKADGKITIANLITGKIRTGHNSIGYRLGNEIKATSSIDYWWVKGLSTNLRLYYKNWGPVVGEENYNAFNDKVKAASAGNRHGGAGRHQGPPPGTGSTTPSRGGPPGGPPTGFAMPAIFDANSAFAAGGSRWSASLGVKAAVFTGASFGGMVEVGKPIYAGQVGELEGLATDWYLNSFLMTSF